MFVFLFSRKSLVYDLIFNFFSLLVFGKSAKYKTEVTHKQ